MGQTVAALKFQILADAAQFVDGIALTKKEIREAAKVAEAAKPAFQKFADERARLSRFVARGALSPDAAAQKLADMQRTQHEEMLRGIPIVGRYAAAMSPLGALGIAATTGIAAMAGAVGTLGAIVAQRIEAIDNIGDAAARLGMGAGELSLIKTAATLGDVDPASMDSLVQKMLVNLGKGSDAFGKLGLSVEDLKQQGTGQIFAEVSAAIAKIPNKADQFKAMAEIFGKTGPEAANLITNFARLREEALQTGAVVGDKLAAKVSEADDAMTRAKLTAEGWANTLTSVAVPAVTMVADALAEVGKSREGTTDFARNLGGLFGGLTPAGSLAGGLGGGWVAGLMNDQRDLLIQDAKLSQQLKSSSDAMKRQLEEEADAWSKIVAAQEAAEMQEHQQAESIRKMIQSIEDETAALRMNAAERAAFKVERAGGLPVEAEAAMDAQDELDFARQKKQVEDEAAKNRIKNAETEMAEVEALKRSLDTPLDLAARKAGRFAELRDAGLLDDAQMKALLMQEARGILGEGGAVGVPGATKGSAAARTAVLEAEHAAKQQRALDEMVKRLSEIRDKKPVEFVLVAGP